jgi:molybdate transport system permease protein
MKIDLLPFLVSIKLSLITTIILLIISFPIALILAFKHFKLKVFFESIITLPLVLPPTVIGFYLLIFFSPRWVVGSFFENVFNIKIIFSFLGIVVASCIYSLPFMIQPLKNGMQNLDRNLLEVSYTLGKSKVETFFRIIIPNIKQSIISGIVMTFAHTMGEFGVILMIGGNISGETRTASIAIYDKVEQLDYNFAHFYSIILILISLFVLIIVNTINSQKRKDVIL